MTKKKKIVLIVVLVVICAILCGIGALAYWQRNTIQAFFLSRNYSAQEREAMLTQQETALLEKIENEMPEAKVRPLSKEEEDKLYSGELSEEDALKLIMDAGTTTESSQSDTNSGLLQMPSRQESANRMEPQTEPAPSNLQNLLAQVYLMRSNFTGQLDSMIYQAKQEVIQSKGTKSIYSVGKQYIGKAAALESQCDAQMNSLLSQIEAELKRLGGDVSMVSDIRAAYEGEKSAKKAELWEKYY